MAPIIKILRGHTAPPTLEAGRIAIDQTNKNLYVGIDDGAGGTINEIVGGSGTFATKQFVTDAVNAATGDLGTMATQDADAVAISGGAIDGTAIGGTTASTGKFTSLDVTTGDIVMSGLGVINMNDGRITNLSAPVDANDAVRKTDLESAISALGNAFQYVGTLNGGATEAQATVVAGQDNNQPGDYYKVAVAGYFVYASGGTAVYANVNDGIVVNSDHGLDIIDNTNSTVAGTSNEISVTGATDTGYTVALATEFKARVDDLETKTQNITATAGETNFAGAVHAGGIYSSAAFESQGAALLHGGAALNGDLTMLLANNINMGSGNIIGAGEIQGFTIDGGEY